MRKRQAKADTKWVVWGLRKGFHPLEEGAWHPLFQYRSQKRAELAATQAPHSVEERPRGREPRSTPWQWSYERYKACPPGRPPVNPAKVKPARHRKKCPSCKGKSLPKEPRCVVCGWRPRRKKQSRAA